MQALSFAPTLPDGTQLLPQRKAAAGGWIRPDLNPIEQFIAKLKALLRRAAARTKEALWAAVGEALEHCTQAECHNFLANSGYDPT